MQSLTCYLHTGCNFLEESIEKDRLKLTHPNHTNDPWEFRLGGNGPCNDIRDEINRMNTEKYGCLCLSHIATNSAMWGHYGNNHCGVALEFEFPLAKQIPFIKSGSVRLDGDIVMILPEAYTYLLDIHVPQSLTMQGEQFGLQGQKTVMRDIWYDIDRTRLPDHSGEIDELILQTKNNISQDMTNEQTLYHAGEVLWQNAMHTKHPSWAYEREVRICFFLDSSENSSITKELVGGKDLYFIHGLNQYLKRVILGVKCDIDAIELEQFIRDRMPEKHIFAGVKQAKYDDYIHQITF